MENFWGPEDNWELLILFTLMLMATFIAVITLGYGFQYTVLLALKLYPAYPVIVFWTVVSIAVTMSACTVSATGLILFYFCAPVLLMLFNYAGKNRVNTTKSKVDQ